MSAPQRLRRIVAVAMLMALAAPAGAAIAAPGSDARASATPLLFSVPGNGSSAGFTIEPTEPLTGCPMVATAWWRITGTGQVITLSTNFSNFDTVLAVYNQGAGAPAPGNRIACNDDTAGQTSQVSFASVRGTSYLVQVGGTAVGGPITLTASAPRPANDDRAAAQPLTTGLAAAVPNTGASQELGELVTCGAVPFAATTWFRWSAPAIGDAVFAASAAFGDTVLTVYRADSGAVVGCNDDGGAAGGPSSLAARVSPGDYLLQIGARGLDTPATPTGSVAGSVSFAVDPDVDGDGDLASTDCNDANPAIRHGVVDIPDDGIDQNCDGADAINLDRDGDGSNRPADCNDANPAINPAVVDIPNDGIDQNCDGADAINLDLDGDGFNRPGDCNDANPNIRPLARDIPGNAIDEDCTGGPAPYPQVASTVRSFAAFPLFRFTTLTIVRAVAGSRIELRCSGKPRCFARKSIRVLKSKPFLSVLRHVRRARLRRGAVVQVRITKPGHVGFMRRITVRAGRRNPKLEDLCLPVGNGKPRSC